MGTAASPAMKFLVVLLSLAALTWAQEDRKLCHCGAFVTMQHSEYEVHRLPAIEVESCEEEKECVMLWRLTDMATSLLITCSRTTTSVAVPGCLMGRRASRRCVVGRDTTRATATMSLLHQAHERLNCTRTK